MIKEPAAKQVKNSRRLNRSMIPASTRNISISQNKCDTDQCVKCPVKVRHISPSRIADLSNCSQDVICGDNVIVDTRSPKSIVIKGKLPCSGKMIPWIFMELLWPIKAIWVVGCMALFLCSWFVLYGWMPGSGKHDIPPPGRERINDYLLLLRPTSKEPARAKANRAV